MEMADKITKKMIQDFITRNKGILPDLEDSLKNNGSLDNKKDLALAKTQEKYKKNDTAK